MSKPTAIEWDEFLTDTPEIFQGGWFTCTLERESGMTVENWTGRAAQVSTKPK